MPGIYNHSQPGRRLIDGDECNVMVWGNYVGGLSGTKVVIRRPASAGDLDVSGGGWVDVTGFAYDAGDEDMANSDGKTIDIFEDGEYAVSTNIGVECSVGSARPRARIIKNGTTVVAASDDADNMNTSSTFHGPRNCFNDIVTLADGDSLVVQVKDLVATGTVNVYSEDSDHAFFHVFKTSPAD